MSTGRVEAVEVVVGCLRRGLWTSLAAAGRVPLPDLFLDLGLLGVLNLLALRALGFSQHVGRGAGGMRRVSPRLTPARGPGRGERPALAGSL